MTTDGSDGHGYGFAHESHELARIKKGVSMRRDAKKGRRREEEGKKKVNRKAARTSAKMKVGFCCKDRSDVRTGYLYHKDTKARRKPPEYHLALSGFRPL
jgi:hypothetical protein